MTDEISEKSATECILKGINSGSISTVIIYTGSISIRSLTDLRTNICSTDCNIYPRISYKSLLRSLKINKLEISKSSLRCAIVITSTHSDNVLAARNYLLLSVRSVSPVILHFKVVLTYSFLIDSETTAATGIEQM